MTYATIKWVDPVHLPTDEYSVEVLSSASPTPKVPIGTVPMGRGELRTGGLSVGPHTFSTVVIDRKGNRSKETVAASITIYPSSDIPPTTNLEVTVVGNPAPPVVKPVPIVEVKPAAPTPAVEVKKPVEAPAVVKPVEVAKPAPPVPQPKPVDQVKK